MGLQGATRRGSGLNLRHLRLFLEVGDQGSQHAASLATGLTQPAISQAIRNLEVKLGCRLFERSRHGMQLSAEGKILDIRARRMFAVLAGMHPWAGTPASFDNRLKMQHLAILVEVDQVRQYSGAARSLGLSAPTVHRLARELDHLAIEPPFRRVGNSIETTATGEHLVAHAGLALVEIAAAIVDLDDLAGASTGSITLGAMPLARTDILPDVICDACESDPKASVDLVEADYHTLIEGMRRGAIDIILGASRGLQAGSDIVEQIIFADELSVFARRGHPLDGRRDITTEDLAQYPWITPQLGSPTRTAFERLFEGQAPRFGLITSSSLVVVRALLARSDRLTLLSRRRALYEEDQGLLVPLDFALPQTRRNICISTRRDWRPTRFQSAFLERLKACN
jgi:LysR family transcriptional regulator, regulator for genes of the gallate degradation pathway